MASKENLLTGVRLLAFLVYGYSIYYQQVNANPFNVHAIGKMKFLTYWDLLLQFSFFTLILISQSLLKIKSKSLTKSIDVIFYSLTLPVSLIVAVTFWGLYAIDREIIFPKAIEKFYPVWLNHATHTLVAVLPFAELWFGKYKLPSKRLSLVILNAFMVVYLAVMLYLALVDNLWVYPFLNLLNWPQRIAFFAGCFVANCAFYYVGVFVTDMKNDSQSRSHSVAAGARSGKGSKAK